VLSKTKIAVIGVGKMGETLSSSLLDAGVVSNDQIIAACRHEERLAYIAEKYGIQTTVENKHAVKEADIVLLCVKPQAVDAVLKDIGPVLNEKQLVISIVASLTTQHI